jgi:hypothetical protein
MQASTVSIGIFEATLLFRGEDARKARKFSSGGLQKRKTGVK